MLVVDELAVRLQTAAERGLERLFVGSALRRRHRVAIRSEERVLVVGPHDGPLDPPAVAVQCRLTGERLGAQPPAIAQRDGEVFDEAAGETQGVARRHGIARVHEGRRADPANLDAAEKIRLRARHAIELVRAEAGIFAEDFGVRVKGDCRSPAVIDRALLAQRRLRLSATVALGPKGALAGHLDGEPVR